MSLRSQFFALALATAASAGFAQQASAPDAAASAAAAQDCPRQARHDHGAERYMPTPQHPCKPKGGAAAAKSSRGKPVQDQDPGKVPKNQ